ncbi:MAG: hypothetical protein KDC98_23585 [Planctomycetes bacterium]|nr:hypothetical protein [Planctomycetota bacterium]
MAGPVESATSDALTPPVSLFAGVLPIRGGTDEPEAEYGIWGGAEPHYKASFHGDMTFVRYLGPSYPENLPVSWRTTSVTIGEHTLMAAGERPVRYHSDTRYEYRFADVTEAYDLTMAGLEQTFTIAKRPVAQGDLVVTGTLSGRLSAEPFAAAHRGFALCDAAGTELVRYGKAWVLDGGGRRQAITTAFDGEQVSLTVPAAFLIDATYPVTIDPLLSPVAMETGAEVGAVDICCFDANSQLMVAYTRIASASDHDCYARLAADNFSSSNVVFNDLSSNWSTPEVRCAAAPRYQTPGYYCVALTRFVTAAAESRLRYHIHLYSSGVLDTTVAQPSNWPGSHSTNIDVGGTSYGPGADHFLLTFQRDDTAPSNPPVNSATSRVVCMGIDLTPLPNSPAVHGNPVPLTGAGGTNMDMERPSINRRALATTSHPLTWLVVWQEWNNNGDTAWDVAARQVDALAVESNSAFFRYTNSAQRLAPRVAGQDGRYVLHYPAATVTELPGKTSSKWGFRTYLHRLDWQIGASTWTSRAIQSIGSSIVADLAVCSVAYDSDTRSHWASVFRRNGGWSFCVRVGYNGVTTEGSASISGLDEVQAAAITFNRFRDQFPIAYAPDDGGATYSVKGRAYTYRSGSPSISVNGTGCGPATITTFNQNVQQIGHEFLGVRVDNADNGALQFLLMSLGGASIPSAQFPGCFLNVDIGSYYLGTQPLRIGATAEWQFALPEWLSVGTSLYFQGLYTDSPITRFYGTRQLRVPLVK